MNYKHLKGLRQQEQATERAINEIATALLKTNKNDFPFLFETLDTQVVHLKNKLESIKNRINEIVKQNNNDLKLIIDCLIFCRMDSNFSRFNRPEEQENLQRIINSLKNETT